eukprot:6184931-Pleurochrysis_carterae.AAC.2
MTVRTPTPPARKGRVDRAYGHTAQLACLVHDLGSFQFVRQAVSTCRKHCVRLNHGSSAQQARPISSSARKEPKRAHACRP